jgi:hypothetical protein
LKTFVSLCNDCAVDGARNADADGRSNLGGEHRGGDTIARGANRNAKDDGAIVVSEGLGNRSWIVTLSVGVVADHHQHTGGAYQGLCRRWVGPPGTQHVVAHKLHAFAGERCTKGLRDGIDGGIESAGVNNVAVHKVVERDVCVRRRYVTVRAALGKTRVSSNADPGLQIPSETAGVGHTAYGNLSANGEFRSHFLDKIQGLGPVRLVCNRG